MRRLLVIGIGAGDPSQITIEAVNALNAADVLFEIDRGADDLTRARQEICERYVTTEPRVVVLQEPKRDRTATAYAEAVRDWRSGRAGVWERAIGELGEEQTGAFLVWGDPSLYDSTIAVLDEIARSGRLAFTRDVIPGISSVHALTARFGIPLNRVGGAVQITTGRRLAEHGWPDGVDDVVVMLDGKCAFRHLVGAPLDIYWSAYLGTPDELLISGPLADVAGEIERVRADARARKGWVMDLYLLRSRSRSHE
jgi:precorrin-6A synthase